MPWRHTRSGVQRGRYTFFNLVARRGWVVKAKPLPFYPRERNPVPTRQEVVWALGPVWTCTENSTPSGFRTPDRRARSRPLHWLRYPGHQNTRYSVQKFLSNIRFVFQMIYHFYKSTHTFYFQLLHKTSCYVAARFGHLL